MTRTLQNTRFQISIFLKKFKWNQNQLWKFFSYWFWLASSNWYENVDVNYYWIEKIFYNNDNEVLTSSQKKMKWNWQFSRHFDHLTRNMWNSRHQRDNFFAFDFVFREIFFQIQIHFSRRQRMFWFCQHDYRIFFRLFENQISFSFDFSNLIRFRKSIAKIVWRITKRLQLKQTFRRKIDIDFSDFDKLNSWIDTKYN